jgi:hypothetical protein
VRYEPRGLVVVTRAEANRENARWLAARKAEKVRQVRKVAA